MLALNTLAIGAASLFAVVAANHGQISRAHHHNPLLERSEAHLKKRFGGQATYYAVGLGACGKHNSPGDFIVALNSAQYGGGYPGPNCFKQIEICAKGKCLPATIMDECPTCDYGCLDLSEGLFTQFAPTGDGVFQMTWSFAGDNEPEPTTEKPHPPKPTEKPDPPKPTKKPEPEPEPTTSSKPRPSPTSKKHTTTREPETTSTPEPTTTSSTPTSTSTSSVPETTSTSQAKSTMTTSTVSATPSPPKGPGAGPGLGSGSSGSNWADMAQIVLAMGRLATTAHSN